MTICRPAIATIASYLSAVDENVEAQLNQVGLEIEEFDFGREDELDITGFIMVKWLDLDHEKYTATIGVRPGTGPEDRAAFATWARDVLARWLEHGPDVDGWQRRESDAGWQLWARRHYFPSLD